MFCILFFLNIHVCNNRYKSLLFEILNTEITLSDNTINIINTHNNRIYNKIKSKFQITISAEKEFIQNTLLNYKTELDNELQIKNKNTQQNLYHIKRINIRKDLITFSESIMGLIKKIKILYTNKYYNLTFLYESYINEIIYNDNTHKNNFIFFEKSLNDIPIFLMMINDEIFKDLKSSINQVYKVLDIARVNNLMEFALFSNVTRKSTEVINKFYEKMIRIVFNESNRMIHAIKQSNEMIKCMIKMIRRYCFLQLLQHGIMKRLIYLIDFKKYYKIMF